MLNHTEVFASLLESGETLRWAGQPQAGLKFRASDAALIPFSIMWCGFACFWEASVLGLTGFAHGHTPPLIFKLWGIPFVLIGLYMVIGRFFADAWRRSKTFYAITNSRVLIVEQKLSLKVTSMELSNLPEIIRTMHAGNLGSISFGPPVFGSSRTGKNAQWSGAPLCPTFEFISDAQQVEKLIRSLRKDLGAEAQAQFLPSRNA